MGTFPEALKVTRVTDAEQVHLPLIESNAINHPWLGMVNHSAYKNGGDWGMVYGIVLPIENQVCVCGL